MNPPENSLTITAEHFLAPLRLPDDPRMSRTARRQLFEVVVEHLINRNLVVGSAAACDEGSTRLDLLVPGTGVHVSIRAVADAELTELITIATAMGITLGVKEAITLSGLYALRQIVTRLRSEYGERSIVEVVAGLKRATADDILAALHGEGCRNLGGGCRYEQDGLCTITQAALEPTLADLVMKGVLRQRTSAPPAEWSVAW